MNGAALSLAYSQALSLLPCLAPEAQARALQAQLQLGELQWHLELTAKLRILFNCVHHKFGIANICVFQAWLALGDSVHNVAPVLPEVSLFAEPTLGVVSDACFQEFRAKSCQAPLQYKNSMPGRVWRTGAVQIVQNMKIIPPSLHPRSQLKEEDLNKLAEVLYIPVFDMTRPAKGPVTVLEVFLSSKAPEAMLVADFISFVGQTLSAVNLSLSNPVPQPIRKSALCGRRQRVPDSAVDVRQAEGQEMPAAAAPPAAAALDAPSAPCPQPSASRPSAPEPAPQLIEQLPECSTSCADGDEGAGGPRKIRKVSGMLRSKSMYTVGHAAGQHVAGTDESQHDEGGDNISVAEGTEHACGEQQRDSGDSSGSDGESS